MSVSYDAVIEQSRKYLELIAKEELTKEEKERVVRETVDGFRNNINPGFLEYRKSVSTDYTAIEWTDSGTDFIDIYGKKFIDCLGGYGIYNVGHRHPKVLTAVMNQLKRQALHSQELLDPLRAMLAKLVEMITPGDLQYCFFTNSGTESVEGAMKLARLHTGRSGFIAAIGGFHGKSMGSLSATSKAVFRKPFLPLLPYFRHVPYGDADVLEKQLASAAFSGEDVAAVILEPILGEGGVIIPPDDYFPRIREICDRYGVVLIADEVQTGMGRTGKMFGLEHYGIVPDILCLGKAFGGGVMPIGAFVSTSEIWEKMTPNPFLHTSTFGGNPVCCAAAIAAINVILEERLPEQAAEKGNYFIPKLVDLMHKYKNICVEARGRGLLIGMEFVSNEVGYQVAKGLFEHGVLVAGTLINAKVIRIEPPLTITKAELDRVLETLGRVLDTVSEQFS
ncbi:MAG: Putrescine aminotransferase [Dehalococcoidia bacterium]|nr:Putrescine aminotransferase [Bacillota bacterium]MBT9142739.1 Putrescine aminotransferase [Bacillota bacterium]